MKAEKCIGQTNKDFNSDVSLTYGRSGLRKKW